MCQINFQLDGKSENKITRCEKNSGNDLSDRREKYQTLIPPLLKKKNPRSWAGPSGN